MQVNAQYVERESAPDPANAPMRRCADAPMRR
jgi:hypothetical protein